ncbi:(2Fe-2S)-binding protein [Sphingobium estronivorans]|uniref:(2Fe-2S)-binding protein n=1 Tax=Sphingobium estronivorans TaxID=1577690 RepID=UPI00123B93CF|nr:(2Fe-2S)-binding protein [Sphingobium estronivorans]
MSKDIAFTLNSRPVRVTVGSHENAVDVLRRFDLFGARESCGQGLCGCCTVRVDGKPLSGCLTLGLKLEGAMVETVESLDAGGELDPVQQAFIDQGAFQCGFCTPGFVMMTKQLLREKPQPDDEEIRSYLSGNLCRCAAYPEIVKAVKDAAARMAAAAA